MKMIYKIFFFVFFSLRLLRSDFVLGGWRAEAVHIWGVAGLSKAEILDYFRDYNNPAETGPVEIEPVDNNSCKIKFWI